MKKQIKCLKCDELFLTTPERRICQICSKWMDKEDRANYIEKPAEPLYGSMGVFEKRDK